MKRRLFKLALFLLLGAIVNVAVALACSYWIQDYPTGKLQFINSNSDRRYAVLSLRAFGSEHVRPRGVNESVLDMYLNTGVTSEEVQPSIFDWSLLRTDETRRFRLDVGEVARGWPMRCLRYYIDGYDIIGGKKIGGELMFIVTIRPGDDTAGRNRGTGRIIPLTPIWPGFAINTIFYAVIIWLLTLGPFTARRMIRSKRGHCLKCGYNLRGEYTAGCPECGWGREAEA